MNLSLKIFSRPARRTGICKDSFATTLHNAQPVIDIGSLVNAMTCANP